MNLGNKVTVTNSDENYNYDSVIFASRKPMIDSDFNSAQEIQNIISQREISDLPSGWITSYPFYFDSDSTNGFYTQNPDGAKPEIALVNGRTLYITGTNTTIANTNFIDLGSPPTSGNAINGIILEM